MPTYTVIRRGRAIRDSEGNVTGYERGESRQVTTDPNRRQTIDVATGKAYNRSSRTVKNGKTVIKAKKSEELREEINKERERQNQAILKRKEKEAKEKVLQAQSNKLYTPLPDEKLQTDDPRFKQGVISNYSLQNVKPKPFEIQTTRNKFDVEYEAYEKQQKGFLGQGTNVSYSQEIKQEYDIRNPKPIIYDNISDIPKAKNYDDYLNRVLPAIRETKMKNASPIGKVFTFTVGSAVIGGMRGVGSVVNPKTYTRDLPQAIKGIPTGETFVNLGTAFVTNPVGTSAEFYTGAKTYGGIARVVPKPAYTRYTVQYGQGELAVGQAVKSPAGKGTISQFKGYQDFTVLKKNLFGRTKEVGTGGIDFIGVSKTVDKVSRVKTTGTVTGKVNGRTLNKIFAEDTLSIKSPYTNPQLSRLIVKDVTKGKFTSSYGAGLSTTLVKEGGFKTTFGVSAQTGRPNIGATIVSEVAKAPQGTTSLVQSVGVAEAVKNINPFRVKPPKAKVSSYVDPASPLLDFIDVRKTPPVESVPITRLPKGALFPEGTKVPVGRTGAGLTRTPRVQDPKNIQNRINKKVNELEKKAVNKQKGENELRPDTSQTPALNNLLRPSTGIKRIIKPLPKTSAKPKTTPVLKQVIKPVPPVKTPVTVVKPPLTKPKLLLPTRRRGTAVNKGGFSAFVKVRGKWLNIGKGLTKKKAVELSKSFVTRRSSASFKVLQGTKPVTKLNLGGIFRRSKKEKGVFVEKRKFRINFGKEVEEITFSPKRRRKRKGGKK